MFQSTKTRTRLREADHGQDEQGEEHPARSSRSWSQACRMVTPVITGRDHLGGHFPPPLRPWPCCVDVVVREMELGTLDGYVMLCCNVCWLGSIIGWMWCVVSYGIVVRSPRSMYVYMHVVCICICCMLHVCIGYISVYCVCLLVHVLGLYYIV